MKNIKFKAEERKLNEAIDTDKYVSGVAYDQSGNSTNIKLNRKDLRAILKLVDKSTISMIEMPDGKEYKCLIKETQIDQRSTKIQHLSFMLLDDNKQAKLPIMIKLENESEAVKNNLGILIKTRNFILIKAFPKDVPESLTLDISRLKDVGESLLVEDLNLPENIKLIHEKDAKLVVVSIRPLQKVEEFKPVVTAETAEEGAEGEEGETPAEGEGTEGTDAVETSEATAETNEK
ncbi:50S ribosomal protein L25 [Candidatus Dojkabacteria bacterium]|nr:50S ribosomal protein L25 [Candidatus Dojkabacteria bacterium]